MYTPQARINTTVDKLVTSPIFESGNGPHSITIEKNGTLGNAGNEGRIISISTNNSDTSTVNLSNKGTINGGVYVRNESGFNGTVTVNTFENTGQVNGYISMGAGTSQGTFNIDNFINSGTMQSKSTVVHMTNVKIKTFTNYGLIDNFKNYSLAHSLAIRDQSTVENFNNIGTIQADSTDSIYRRSKHHKKL
ncbi:hypothetical protein [Campylobacter jejuni]|uniref:Autotransporter n=1 Tax=Campylobacter jejuni TaxID=197 RepID=A0A431FV51_CAMJU|nr:hypothetical protein [Campylobacter jejuni]RTJ97417.1 hypothetical protein C3H48_09270 [Campylobacter jejuni]